MTLTVAMIDNRGDVEDSDDNSDDKGIDSDDEDDDHCDISKRHKLTCSSGVDNNVKKSANAILPIRMFVVVCICFAVKIASTVSKLPITSNNEIIWNNTV